MKNQPRTANTAFIYSALLGLLIMAAGVLVYFPSLHAPFVFDDTPNIVLNPAIRMFHFSPGDLQRLLDGPSASRPLAMVTFALNYSLGKYKFFGYHLVNLLIHLVTALLVMVITRHSLRLLDWPKSSALPVAFFAAMLWLLNPLISQSVTYIVQRMNAMAALFYLLTMVCYIQARLRQIHKRGNTSIIVLLFVLGGFSGLAALASKPNSATLPILLLLYEWYFFQQCRRSWLKEKIKWILAVLIIFVFLGLVFTGWNPIMKLLSPYAEQAFTLSQRLLTEPAVVIYYLSLLFWPHPDRLILDYDFPVATGLLSPPVTVLSLAALAALLLLAGYAGKKHRLVSFAVLWFLGTLVIESSVIGLALIFEHRTYLPSVFIAIAVSGLIWQRIHPRLLARGLLYIAIVVSAAWTWQRNHTWADKTVFWEDMVHKAPAKAQPWNGLGQARHETGLLEEALACFRQAASLDPSYAEAHNNIGGILLDMDQPGQAIPHLRQALKANPDSHQALDNMGSACYCLGDFEKAVQYFRQALAVYPDYPNSRNNLGNALLRLGATTEAIYHFKKAIQIDPGYAEAYNNLGLAVNRQGETERAIAYYRQAVNLDPFNARAHFNLGSIYFQKNNLEQAAYHLEKAVTNNSKFVLALNNLATVRVLLKQYAKAAGTLRQLAKVRPDSPTVFYNLACVYSLMNEKEAALEHLEKAIALGYRKWDHINTDPDLDNVRQTDRFQQLLPVE